MTSSFVFRVAARFAAVAVLLTSLPGCGIWFGEVDNPPLPGERVSVMMHQRALTPDPTLSATPIALPRPQRNPEWPQAGGYANHAMHHLWIADTPDRAWRADIGTSPSKGQPRLPPPVAARGRVFAMDAEHRISAYDAAAGQRLWQVSIRPRGERDLITGGIAYENGRMFAAGGFAEVVALDAETGAEVWRTPVDAPIHGPPTVRDGRVFAITLADTLYALQTTDGAELWTYQSVGEVASLVGTAAPAVDQNIVVAGFRSGELVALRANTGRELWNDSLASRRRTDEVANISQIAAAPVIDRGRVFAIGNGGVMVAVDLNTGRRIWETGIGGLNRPWVAGNHLYVITDNNELVSLSRDNGGIHWIVELPAWENPEKRRGPLLWSGPVLVGDRLVVTSSRGEALALSPYSGRTLGSIEVAQRISVSPIAADGSLFFLSDDAMLLAYR